jgi:hypothetical protein
MVDWGFEQENVLVCWTHPTSALRKWGTRYGGAAIKLQVLRFARDDTTS